MYNRTPSNSGVRPGRDAAFLSSRMRMISRLHSAAGGAARRVLLRVVREIHYERNPSTGDEDHGHTPRGKAAELTPSLRHKVGGRARRRLVDGQGVAKGGRLSIFLRPDKRRAPRRVTRHAAVALCVKAYEA